MRSNTFRANTSFLILSAAYALLLGVLYWAALQFLVGHKWAQEDFNYAYLIPFIVLYLVWIKKEAFSKIKPTPSWSGFILIAFAIFLLLIGELGGEFYSLYLSCWLFCIGIFCVYNGWRRLRTMAFPIFFSLALFPFPSIIYSKFSMYLKLISSFLGVRMLQYYGMPAYREGNVIDLGFVQLQVVDACSGLRYLVPLVILSILVAYFQKSSIFKKILLVVSSFPIAIITNSMRIALTGVIYRHWGAEVAEGFFHGFSGWLIFIISFLLLMLEVYILSFLPSPSRSKNREKNSSTQDADNLHKNSSQHSAPLDDAPVRQERLKSSNPIFTFQSVTIIAVICLCIFVSKNLDFSEKIPVARNFDSFPLTVGDWTGRRSTMDAQIIENLDLTDYLIADYINQSQSINLYIAYYESQKKGESIHSPSSCIPGSGWIFDDTGIVSVNSGTVGSTININRAIIQKGNSKQLAYYWFPSRGRILTNGIQLKLYNFWDALTIQRTDGALVRLITPINENENIEAVEKRLRNFVGLIVPILDNYLPSGA